MAELDKKLKITARFAECFRDYREPSKVDYSVHQLLAQRVYGITLGYEDVNDHDKLRYDPALAIALEKLNFIDSPEPWLPGKSTVIAMATNNQKIPSFNFQIRFSPQFVRNAGLPSRL